MNVWVMLLVIGTAELHPKIDFESRDDCIKHGQEVIKAYREHHKVSPAWFWCYMEERT